MQIFVEQKVDQLFENFWVVFEPLLLIHQKSFLKKQLVNLLLIQK